MSNTSFRNFLRRLPLTADVTARMLAEDPLLFTIQTARKLPARPRRLVASLLPENSGPAGLRALRAMLLDHRTKALEILQIGRAGSNHSRLENELLIQLGHPVADAPDPRTEARSLWAQGNVSGIDMGSLGGKLAQRFSGEQTALAPGTGISLPSSKLPQDTSPTADEDTRPPRVLYILTNSLPWTRSGYTYRTQSILKAVQDSGVVVLGVTRLGYPTTIGALSANDRDVVDGIEYQRLLPRRWLSSPADRLVVQAKEIVKIVHAFRPDVIHTTTNYMNGLVADAVSRATGVPWIYEMRGYMEQTWVARQPEEFQEERANSEYYRLMRDRETEMAARANAVIALSNVQKKDLVSRGIPAEKISILPNSVDEAILDTPRDKDGARERLGLANGSKTFWIGTVTSVVDYEGLPTLLEATRILRDQGMDVRCAVVGDGVALPDLKLLAAALRLDEEDAIVFPGRVSKPETSNWYQALDVFVIPRVDTLVTRNVAPIKGLEAMALGIPVITSDLPVLTESVSGVELPHFSAAVPNELAEAVKTLLTDSETLGSASYLAKSEASARTWEQGAQTLRQTYER